ncbi:MAG: hypothetical protein KF802_09060 [Bdellovibrionaceae bacterium]|nr:hypothetical protein [Pseudobdellovibrionaceae bacterium]
MKTSICLFGALFLVACSSQPNKMESRAPAYVSSEAIAEAARIPDGLHIYSPAGEPIPISLREATVDEATALWFVGESGNFEKDTRQKWRKNPKSYYRWSKGDVDAINEVARGVHHLLWEKSPGYEKYLPRVVVAKIQGKERVVAVGNADGTVALFHSDSELQKQGYEGLETAIVADYLRHQLQRRQDAVLKATDSTQGFYVKLGFARSGRKPEAARSPANEQFQMLIETRDIPSALAAIKAGDARRMNSPGGE